MYVNHGHTTWYMSLQFNIKLEKKVFKSFLFYIITDIFIDFK